MAKKGQKAKAVGKAAARGVGLVMLPAVPATTDIVRNRRVISAQAAAHMKALRAGESGAKLGALKSAGRALGPLSTYILPALAGAAAFSTARDVYKKHGDATEAAKEGAFAAADLLLGHALTEYSKSKAKGESRASAVATATLKGIDNRFLFGMFQYAMNAAALRTKSEKASDVPSTMFSAGAAPSAPDPTTVNIVRHETESAAQMAARAVEDRRKSPSKFNVAATERGGPGENSEKHVTERRLSEAKKTSSIVAAGMAGAWQRAAMQTVPTSPSSAVAFEIFQRGMAGPGNSTGPRRLNQSQQEEFAARNRNYSPDKGRGKAAPGSGENRKGWANPKVQMAAQKARGVANVTDWADG